MKKNEDVFLFRKANKFKKTRMEIYPSYAVVIGLASACLVLGIVYALILKFGNKSKRKTDDLEKGEKTVITKQTISRQKSYNTPPPQNEPAKLFKSRRAR